ncbi:hypothetical protein JMJ77_0012838 [Colletotrichum scovillei]|uniref:Uncharacterized protein n=1 Tax=Colletotrichum scovillei TaxID=1209932 RepID=A0A9P7R7T7_9PEZI|nr:hypothetical protein JMJ77_0012838 [Colletotrichum scovillei]KAG7069121.1 hypothetical protein JMJ76_0002797 [Colletotrichum scovillei]KAG7073073.1 hypothetical protein JMJ78_0014054 [Colletotrichum scovillei]
MTVRRASRPLSLSYSVAVVRASQLQSDVSDLLPNRISLDMLIDLFFSHEFVFWFSLSARLGREVEASFSSRFERCDREWARVCTTWMLAVSWTWDLDLVASFSTTMNNSRFLSFSLPWMPASIAYDSNKNAKLPARSQVVFEFGGAGIMQRSPMRSLPSSDILSSMPAGTRDQRQQDAGSKLSSSNESTASCVSSG